MNTRFIPTPESMTLSAMTLDTLALFASLPPTASQTGTGTETGVEAAQSRAAAAQHVPAGICPACTKCRLYDGMDTCFNCDVRLKTQATELWLAWHYPENDPLLGPLMQARHARREDAAWAAVLVLLLAAAVWLGLAVRGGGAI